MIALADSMPVAQLLAPKFVFSRLTRNTESRVPLPFQFSLGSRCYLLHDLVFRADAHGSPTRLTENTHRLIPSFFSLVGRKSSNSQSESNIRYGCSCDIN